MPDVVPSGQPPRSWWSRNWKWVVPVGVIAPLLLCGTCAVVVIFGAFNALRSHEVTQHAVARAKTDPEVVALLGQPIDLGRLVSGVISRSGSTEEADLAIPISGPNGSATIEAQATKSADAWN